MDFLLCENIMKAADETPVTGLVFIQNYGTQPQKNGGQYIAGNLQAKGQVPFKVWSSNYTEGAYQKMLNEDYSDSVCRVAGKVNLYGGIVSLIITDIEKENEEGYSKFDFMEDVYNANEWWLKMLSVLQKNCSPTAVSMFEKIVAPIKDNFMMEYAAVFHHDNCKSGLLAHTTKLLRIANLVKMYPALMGRISPDLLYIACALHDVGKVFEYSNGVVSERGRVLSHHTFGVLYLVDKKDLIVSSMGEDFFYNLLAVIEQHHGEYEERPRTIAAYVIHKLDALDSNLTSLNTLIEKGKATDQIQYDGFRLV